MPCPDRFSQLDYEIGIFHIFQNYNLTVYYNNQQSFFQIWILIGARINSQDPQRNIYIAIYYLIIFIFISHIWG